jgi:hypothetical protein
MRRARMPLLCLRWPWLHTPGPRQPVPLTLYYARLTLDFLSSPGPGEHHLVAPPRTNGIT